ncbi:MAG: aromatic ring-hydroxylating dioxygenase subunit alpha [Alphaproteobacteria bacterium]
MSDGTEFIYDMWYIAAPSAGLARGKTLAKTLLGQKVLLGRDKGGAVFALRDFCPHRGVPLHYGRFDGTTVECCYHGWCFDTAGQCTKIPALPPDSNVDISRIRAGSFPCREVDGNIWVFVPQPGRRELGELPPLPAPPIPLKGGWRRVATMLFPCDIDHAALGLMDPSHGSWVHASWWWRPHRGVRVKEKKFAPHGLGFRMLRHAPSANSRAYKLLGGNIATEITFELPGLRTEHITAGRHHIILLTALTPIDATSTELHQCMYSTIPLVNLFKPVLTLFGKVFIRQDLDIVRKQAEGLASGHPHLMLLGDADQQAVWYNRLKKDYLAAQKSGAPFTNPVPEKTLRWCS